MKLLLNPDPGTGRHWRLTLQIGLIELYCDVARREEPEAALIDARNVAEELGLVASGPDEWSRRRGDLAALPSSAQLPLLKEDT